MEYYVLKIFSMILFKTKFHASQNSNNFEPFAPFSHFATLTSTIFAHSIQSKRNAPLDSPLALFSASFVVAPLQSLQKLFKISN